MPVFPMSRSKQIYYFCIIALQFNILIQSKCLETTTIAWRAMYCNDSYLHKSFFLVFLIIRFIHFTGIDINFLIVLCLFWFSRTQ